MADVLSAKLIRHIPRMLIFNEARRASRLPRGFSRRARSLDSPEKGRSRAIASATLLITNPMDNERDDDEAEIEQPHRREKEANAARTRSRRAIVIGKRAAVDVSIDR